MTVNRLIDYLEHMQQVAMNHRRRARPHQHPLHPRLSILNPTLRGHARLEGVFHQLHLGHGVGNVVDFLRAAASGQAHVDVGGALGQGVEHVCRFEPAGISG